MISSFKIPENASIEEKLMIQYSINKQLINELKRQNFALGQMQSLKDEVEDLRNTNQVSFLKRKLKELEGKLCGKNEKLKIANVEIEKLRKQGREPNPTTIRGKSMYLGSFEKENEAHLAVVKAKSDYLKQKNHT